MPFDATNRSLLPLIAGFVLLLAVASGAVFLTQAQSNAASWVRHTLEVENRISTIRILATDAEAGERGFLITGEEAYRTPYLAVAGSIWDEVSALARQTADNPEQQKAILDLRVALEAELATFETAINLRASGDAKAATALFETKTDLREKQRVRDILEEMKGTEERLLKIRSQRAQTATGFGQVILGLAIALTLALGAFTLLDSRRRIRALHTANVELVREASERQAAEAQLRHLNKMEAVGQLTGGIAHDFNNMLAIISGAVSVARRRLAGSEHPAIAQCLDAAATGVRRAAELTAQLLAFSRKAPLAPKVIDVGQLARATSELLRRTLGERCEIETVIAGGLWRVKVDPAQVETSLVNLGVNARDAMPDGGKLTIEAANAELDDRYARAHAEVTAGQYVVISMTDTGQGMAPDIAERAFEPFFTTKEVGQGTGLGLSSVFGFVKQSGGHLKIYSEVGQGTTVKLYLPRYIGAEAPAELSRSAAPALGRKEEIILVVEDDVSVRAMSVSLLKELGYSVIELISPHDALAKLETNPAISLLFTDIVMPQMTGRELVEKARETRPKLKALYTTGYTRNAVVHNGVLDPGTPFLPKPFTLEDLAAKVRETLDANS